ncbi:NDP-glycosyltransferase YjiC-like [Oppia nitens]|uniref:NDP-glycosyltransferase YjiC-like n=1 Tax=Oppia nitens TaxID=1686743 RepID=UPI0023D9BC24|nr:NDP-glycosyltransferase YjiC-like [Oppia nitens]
MGKSLKILVVPIQGVGHVNACLGVAQVLIDAGHRVMFTVHQDWCGKLKPYGIEEIVVSSDTDTDEDNPNNNTSNNSDNNNLLSIGGLPSGDSLQSHAEGLLKVGNISGLLPLEKASRTGPKVRMWMKRAIHVDQQLERLIPELRPDLIVLDQFLQIPAVDRSGIPCVWSWSTNPVKIIDNDGQLPPCGSGLSAYGDKNQWREYREVRDNAAHNVWQEFNNYIVGRGCQPLDTNCLANTSNCLNIYGYPLELDYLDVRPLPKNYIRFDNLMRYDQHMQFELPEQLLDKPGKLIYFSLGSMGAVDVINMKRLVAILAKSQHRFIVSKGPKHYEYDLPDNMWGQSSVPQIQVLPLVDLVITHGGNNTISETFFYGKPVIVLPLFGDQYDNGQRVDELGYGRRLNAYNCTDRELLTAIDSILNDNELNDKLQKISQRIQSDNSLEKLPKIIEDFIENPTKYLDINN